MILFATLFIIIVSVGLYWANQEDKRRFRKKEKEKGVEDFDTYLTGDINTDDFWLRRSVHHHNNIQQ